MRLIIFYCVMLMSFISFTQEELTYSSVDEITYNQFLKDDYKSLKETTNKALDAGIDFYTLRMRIGIITYNHKNYAGALTHFNKAYEMNPNDSIVQEYIYYSLVFSDQIEESRAFASLLSLELQHKIGYTKNTFDNIVFSAGYNFNNNASQNENSKFYSSEYKNIQTLFNENSVKGNVLFKNTIGKRFQLMNGLNYYNLGAKGSIELANNRLTKDYRNNYIQYNLGVGYQFKKGWMVSGGFGFYHTNVSTYSIIAGNINPMMPPPSTPPINFVTEDNIYNNFATSLTVGKRFHYFYPTISFHISDFYDETKTQEEFNLTIYPFGNTNLYATSSLNYVNGSSSEYVIGQKIGFKLSNRIFVDADYASGNFSNRITSNGFMTYNSMDKITSQTGINIHYYTKSKLEYILSGYTQQRQANLYKFTNLTDYQTGNYNYINNSITFTAKWNF